RGKNGVVSRQQVASHNSQGRALIALAEEIAPCHQVIFLQVVIDFGDSAMQAIPGKVCSLDGLWRIAARTTIANGWVGRSISPRIQVQNVLNNWINSTRGRMRRNLLLSGNGRVRRNPDLFLLSFIGQKANVPPPKISPAREAPYLLMWKNLAGSGLRVEVIAP